MVERSSDHSTDLLLDHAVLARSRGEHTLLGVTQDVGQGLLVRLVNHRLSAPVGERPRHADALRCAEGEVESGDGTGDLRLGGALFALDLEHLGVPLSALETYRLGADASPDALRIWRLLCARRTAELFSGEGVLDHPEHPEEMLLGHLGAGLDAHSVAQAREALADESTWWCSRFGVVPRQRGRVLRRSIGLCDGAHEVLVPAAQSHPPDRYRHPQPSPHRPSMGVLGPVNWWDYYRLDTRFAISRTVRICRDNACSIGTGDIFEVGAIPASRT